MLFCQGSVNEGKLKEGLYQLDVTYQIAKNFTHESVLKNKFSCNLSSAISSHKSLFSTSDVWHKRLGHPSSQVMNQVLKFCNIKIKENDIRSFCNACQLGKAHLLPFPSSSSQAKVPLELVFTDIWGQAPILSTSGFKYYISFLDDYSRFTWIYPLKQKSEALSVFLQFKKLVENELECKIKTLQANWGGEYRSFSKFLSQEGVEFRHPCPYTSAQNGRIERKHRHVTEMGLTLLAQAKLPLKYWWEAFQTATYLINRLPTPVLQNQSPYRTLYNKQPSYQTLKIFGCACYPCLRPYQNHKFGFHSIKCIFLGYNKSYKG